ncbi:MAG: SRPBCC domain-containing protein [Devosia nanyangense]|nr:SRPBCC domain-containing protein [Devosia nanyangense]
MPSSPGLLSGGTGPSWRSTRWCAASVRRRPIPSRRSARRTRRARHWTVEDRQVHEKMGFHEGWGMCADQLEELLKRG